MSKPYRASQCMGLTTLTDRHKHRFFIINQDLQKKITYFTNKTLTLQWQNAACMVARCHLFWSVSSACHKDATHAKKDVLELRRLFQHQTSQLWYSKEDPTIQETSMLVYYTLSPIKRGDRSIISLNVGWILIVLSLGKAMRRPDVGVRYLKIKVFPRFLFTKIMDTNLLSLN